MPHIFLLISFLVLGWGGNSCFSALWLVLEAFGKRTLTGAGLCVCAQVIFHFPHFSSFQIGGGNSYFFRVLLVLLTLKDDLYFYIGVNAESTA